VVNRLAIVYPKPFGGNDLTLLGSVTYVRHDRARSVTKQGLAVFFGALNISFVTDCDPISTVYMTVARDALRLIPSPIDQNPCAH